MEAEAINITAVAVGAVVAFIYGALIYHPRVLGMIWANGSGVALDGKPPVLAIVLQVLALLALALVVGMTATVSFLGTALLAIAAAALFVVAGGVLQKKPRGALATDGIYVVGAGALMIIAQGFL